MKKVPCNGLGCSDRRRHYESDEPRGIVWVEVPDDYTGPAYGILDQCWPIVPIAPRGMIHIPTEHLGCEELDKQVAERIKPNVHIFGHIHGSYGNYENKVTRFYNVAICDEQYFPVNPVTIIDI